LSSEVSPVPQKPAKPRIMLNREATVIGRVVRDVSGRPYLRQKLAEAYVWFFGGKFGSELFKGLGRIHWPRRKDKSLLARAAALALFAVPRLQRRGLPPVRNL
jgi:hypothetical protein